MYAQSSPAGSSAPVMGAEQRTTQASGVRVASQYDHADHNDIAPNSNRQASAA